MPSCIGPREDLRDASSRTHGRRRPFRWPPIIGEHGIEQVPTGPQPARFMVASHLAVMVQSIEEGRTNPRGV
jgi:hypothetical protein